MLVPETAPPTQCCFSWEDYGGVLVVETSTGPMRVSFRGLGHLSGRPKVALRPYRLSPSNVSRAAISTRVCP